MRAEEQLKLAYMTIAELKNQNEKLVNALASMERRLAESGSRERREVEGFYIGMMEDMRADQAREMECLRASQAKEMAQLRETMQRTMDGLTARPSALAASGRVNAGRLYGRKSEKSGRLNKRRDDDDRNQGGDNFDGTAGSDKGLSADADAQRPGGGRIYGQSYISQARRLLRAAGGRILPDQKR